MAHTHNIVDTDVHYKIDGVTRTITNVNEVKRELVQGDHNSERFTFEVPRHVDSHDFSECNTVEVHYTNYDKFGKAQSEDVYRVEDLNVNESDDSIVTFSWLISRNATVSAGTLDFSIRLSCVVNGEEEYAWNTTDFSGIKILPSRNHTEKTAEKFPDLLSSWKAEFKEAAENTINEVLSGGDYKGEKGDKGDPGEGLKILGSYTSESALIAAHPTGAAGDAYMIGTNMYVWSATENKWIDAGNIKGDPGEKGEPGNTPVLGVDYYTEADKSEIITTVLASLPTWTGGSY